MANPQAPINNTMNAGNPATLPTHTSIATYIDMRGSRHNIVIPLPLDPPAPDIMDPALGLGLHNPDEDVQKMADGASAKMEHASVMRSAEAERSNAREFVRRFEPERPDEPANPAVLTNEELAAYEELIDERQLEGMAEAEEEAKERGEGEGGPAASQQKKKKKQPPPEPKGMAWFLQRGKELDSKRI